MHRLDSKIYFYTNPISKNDNSTRDRSEHKKLLSIEQILSWAKEKVRTESDYPNHSKIHVCNRKKKKALECHRVY